jgi:hypothetical protein
MTICNIDRDWMIYRKHPIRSLLTSMLRKASFRYPSDVYTLSFEKYKGKIRCSLKMSKNMNKHAIKRKSATENYILKFLTVSSVSSDSIVKRIIDEKMNCYAHDCTGTLRIWKVCLHSNMYA